MVLRKLRMEHGYTQSEMAKILNMSRVAYTNIENEKRDPNTETLLRLADLYHVSLDDLFGREYEKPAINYGGLREDVVNLLLRVHPDDMQRVVDFVSGLLAAREG